MALKPRLSERTAESTSDLYQQFHKLARVHRGTELLEEGIIVGRKVHNDLQNAIDRGLIHIGGRSCYIKCEPHGEGYWRAFVKI